MATGRGESCVGTVLAVLFIEDGIIINAAIALLMLLLLGVGREAAVAAGMGVAVVVVAAEMGANKAAMDDGRTLGDEDAAYGEGSGERLANDGKKRVLVNDVGEVNMIVIIYLFGFICLWRPKQTITKQTEAEKKTRLLLF